MAILLSNKTNVMIQGITGKEGQRAARAMRDYHTQVACGVTPGKGGQEVDGVPVFNTVAEAIAAFPDINASLVVVPPVAAKNAVLASIEQGIPLINVVVERIPLRDASYMLCAARESGVRVVGPSSIGIIAPGVGRLGLIGGPVPDEIYRPGPVGIISRSGGMANELSWIFRQDGMGQSTALGIGGDLLIGTSYGDLLLEFEKDNHTRAVAVFGEMGGDYEYEIVDLMQEKRITKPVAMFIGGRFGKNFPEGMPLGHAGAIIDRGRGSVEEKEHALREAGVMVASDINELPVLIKERL